MNRYKNLMLPVLMAFAFSGLQAQEQLRVGEPKLTEQWNPKPRIVNPGKTSQDPPSDAIVLFNGTDASAFEAKGGGPVKWKSEDGSLNVVGGKGEIHTKDGFGDCQLHIEWRTPAEVKGDGQGRGNSGIFFMGRYELQVLDSYNNLTYSNGQAASIYKQLPPLVNASRGPGEWQTYDVIFNAPQFYEDGSVKSQARITVFHNGVLVQDHVPVKGDATTAAKFSGVTPKGPLFLQDHGNPVQYRNIWVRRLD